MSHVTTHVLDTTRGRPAEGIPVVLSGPDGVIARAVTNPDGRVPDLGPEMLTAGDYRLEFDTGLYFAASGTESFYPRVVVEFIIADTEAHYHVPLLLSPFGYSTYRGS